MGFSHSVKGWQQVTYDGGSIYPIVNRRYLVTREVPNRKVVMGIPGRVLRDIRYLSR